MFVGLVSDPERQRPEGFPGRRRRWPVPWRAIAVVAVFCFMLWLVHVVERAFGPFAGYACLLAAITFGGWQLDRGLGPGYWRGLKDYQA